jgi:endonuclease/exonuclease/phosphatase family metal-dependent hydrolase
VCYQRKILDQTAIQNIAVLHKCNVRVTNQRWIADSDNGNSSLRKALVVDVKVGQFDFILIAVHMKAGRGPTNRSVRDNQAQATATFIGTETAGLEKDVILVGDYNMIPGQDDSNFIAMDPQDFLHYVSSEDLTFSHISSSGNPGNLLDGFAVSRNHTREYIAGTLRVFPMNRALGLSLLEYRQQVSDHLPVVARFRIVEDDD